MREGAQRPEYMSLSDFLAHCKKERQDVRRESGVKPPHRPAELVPRIKEALKNGPLTVEQLAERLGQPAKIMGTRWHKGKQAKVHRTSRMIPGLVAQRIREMIARGEVTKEGKGLSAVLTLAIRDAD